MLTIPAKIRDNKSSGWRKQTNLTVPYKKRWWETRYFYKVLNKVPAPPLLNRFCATIYVLTQDAQLDSSVLNGIIKLENIKPNGLRKAIEKTLGALPHNEYGYMHVLMHVGWLNACNICCSRYQIPICYAQTLQTSKLSIFLFFFLSTLHAFIVKYTVPN